MSYKRLGDMVKFISNKNTDGNATVLFGINIDKFFMPSVANIIGVDLKKYKVVEKFQFACNRMHVGRDERLPISMSTFDYDFIVSPAYDVFEVITSDVLPEYLMLWFRRKEFDRQCWFYTDADVRGGLHLDALKSIEIKIPSIEEQRQIVAQYQSIANKIKVNEQICEKLEATAQALYKHWFVDLEFPNEVGKPYKSSGGKMVWNEELGKEIPEGWELSKISRIAKVKHGYAFKGDDFSELETENVLVSPGNFSIRGGFYFERNKYYSGTINKNYVLSEYDLVVNMTDLSKAGDTLGNTAIIPYISFKKLLHNQRVGLFEFENKGYNYLIFLISQTKEYKHYILGTATGTTVRHTSPDRICDYTILLPEISQLSELNIKLEILVNRINLKHSLIYKLTQLQSLLLSRLAVGEEELINLNFIQQ